MDLDLDLSEWQELTLGKGFLGGGGGGEAAKPWPICHTCRKGLGDKYPQVRPGLELLRRY